MPSIGAEGFASELKIDFHPYGAAQHCRYRQNIPRGLPRGRFNQLKAKSRRNKGELR